MKNILQVITFAVIATALVGCNEKPLIILNIDSKVFDSNNQIVEGSLIEVKKTYFWRITNFNVQNEYKNRIPTGGLEVKLAVEFSNDELRENNEDLEGKNFGDFAFTRVGDIFESPRALYSDREIDFSGLNFKISQTNMLAGTSSNEQIIKFSFITDNAVIRVNDSTLNTYQKPVYVTKTTYSNIGFSLAAGGDEYGLVYLNIPVGVRTIIVRAFEPLTNNIVVTPKTYNESSIPALNSDEEYLILNFYSLVLVGYGNNQQLASQARVIFEITYQESNNYLSATYQRGIDFSNLSYFEV
jgi:hypothetical protein